MQDLPFIENIAKKTARNLNQFKLTNLDSLQLQINRKFTTLLTDFKSSLQSLNLLVSKTDGSDDAVSSSTLPDQVASLDSSKQPGESSGDSFHESLALTKSDENTQKNTKIGEGKFAELAVKCKDDIMIPFRNIGRVSETNNKSIEEYINSSLELVEVFACRYFYPVYEKPLDDNGEPDEDYAIQCPHVEHFAKVRASEKQGERSWIDDENFSPSEKSEMKTQTVKCCMMICMMTRLATTVTVFIVSC